MVLEKTPNHGHPAFSGLPVLPNSTLVTVSTRSISATWASWQSRPWRANSEGKTLRAATHEGVLLGHLCLVLASSLPLPFLGLVFHFLSLCPENYTLPPHYLETLLIILLSARITAFPRETLAIPPDFVGPSLPSTRSFLPCVCHRSIQLAQLNFIISSSLD